MFSSKFDSNNATGKQWKVLVNKSCLSPIYSIAFHSPTDLRYMIYSVWGSHPLGMHINTFSRRMNVHKWQDNDGCPLFCFLWIKPVSTGAFSVSTLVSLIILRCITDENSSRHFAPHAKWNKQSYAEVEFCCTNGSLHHAVLSPPKSGYWHVEF